MLRPDVPTSRSLDLCTRSMLRPDVPTSRSLDLCTRSMLRPDELPLPLAACATIARRRATAEGAGMGRLTTHVLDTAHGCPAAGMHIELWRLDPPDRPQILQTTTTNRDGRTDQPLLEGEALSAGRYQLVFGVASYFRSRSVELPDPPFLDQVVLQFGVADPQAHYHVPLLTSPWAYSTYRGS